jgi:hypothetical protein
MIDWPDGVPIRRLDDPLPTPRLHALHRRRRWPLITRRRARWAVAVQLCHSRPAEHCSPPAPVTGWQEGCCGGCWEDAEAWLSARA